jgi:hypothetical protein
LLLTHQKVLDTAANDFQFGQFPEFAKQRQLVRVEVI